MKIVVYTALTTDNLDYLRGELVKYVIDKDGVDFIAYTNSPYLKSDFWEVRPIEIYRNARRTARRVKLLPQEYLSEYDIWLWMDNQIYFNCNPKTLIGRYLDNFDMAVHRHCDRNCIYEEAKACQFLDDPKVIAQQMSKYMADEHLKDNGLYETGILFRRNNEEVIKFNESWWNELDNYSLRDQLSFPYVLSKSNVIFNPINKTFVSHNYKNKHLPLTIDFGCNRKDNVKQN